MSLSSSTPKFRIAICGAGIGGLFLAVTIGKFAGRDVCIDLYEAHDAITTAGAGIAVSGCTMEVIKALGLYEEISRVSTKPPSSSLGPTFRKSDTPEGGFEWCRHTVARHDPSTMHRQHLVDILKQHIPSSCTIHFNKRLTKYDKLSAGLLVLHFADESTETTDVLIGADGIHSSVRKILFETIDRDVVDSSKIRHYTDPSWTGTFIYRAVFPVEKLSEIDPNNVALKNFVVFCGKGKHIVSYPVSQGTLINVSAIVSDEQKAGTPSEGRWVSDVSRDEVEEAYHNYEPAVKSLLMCMEHPSRWALHVVNELPLSGCDRVALIGDACHGMTPYMAAGAGQAMEVRAIIQAQDYFNSYTKDAFVLGRLLSHPLATLDNVSAALKAYQDVRLPDAQLIARKSKRAGDFVQFNEPGYYDGTDKGNAREELQILAEVMTDNLESQYQNGAIVGWKRAERILQESVGLCNDCHKDASLFLPYNDLDSIC